jgi:hypothetical protein
VAFYLFALIAASLVSLSLSLELLVPPFSTERTVDQSCFLECVAEALFCIASFFSFPYRNLGVDAAVVFPAPFSWKVTPTRPRGESSTDTVTRRYTYISAYLFVALRSIEAVKHVSGQERL